MPLFPTMYGQLTAIAREYNFPSTTGLCLYLHYTDSGITATPRISDDSWQMIWNHAFDPAPSSAAAPSLPISGKIEFDIDLRLARWYGAWMALSHREHVDVPMSVTPSAAPSVIHYREESRTTFADGEDQENHLVARPARHVPRKLSLVDRFDVMSVRSVPRSVVARAPPAEQLPGSQNLPPIFQEDEPKTAKHDLEHRVNSWRHASVPPGGFSEVGHILLAGSNLPSPHMDESPILTNDDDERNDDERNDDDEYRLEDYSFSISSAGPGDYDPYSPLNWDYDPSVHLAHRAQGSVCMTESYRTSFGPSDYTLSPYVPSFDLDGVRTPDIAHRMLEDVPPSPSVATSWGAPLSYPPSPTSEYHARSVHLGDRGCFSRPVTPMTATSWGAPESYPPSPTTPFYVRTPDAGQRTFDLSSLSDQDVPWSLEWPHHNTSGTALEQRRSAGPWKMVWPYLGSNTGSSGPLSITNSTAGYPHFDLYPAVSGAFVDTARSAALGDASGPVTIRLAPAYPVFDLYPATYPGNLDEIYPAHPVLNGPSAISTQLSPRYPTFDLYPAVYPHVVPYPPYRYEMEARRTQDLTSVYPHFNLYPPIATYAKAKVSQTAPSSRGSISVILQTAYPVFNLYPAIYPAFDIYPAVDASSDCCTQFVLGTDCLAVDRGSVSIQLTTGYPIFNLYPAVYPVFDLYPVVPKDCQASRAYSAGYPDFNIYPAISQAVSRARQAPKLKPAASTESTGPISVRLPASYPVFDLYPPVYPVLEIYPEIPEDCAPGSRRVAGLSVQLATAYPIFNLYPAVYPVFDMYPALPEDCALGSRLSPGIPIRLEVAYPIFDLYPAVYPAFDIYPSLPADCMADLRPTSSISIGLTVNYPIFNLYPAVYPAFDIYPSLPPDTLVSQVSASYGYPHFNLYPQVGGPVVDAEQKHTDIMTMISVRLAVAYPIFDLYPAVYPAFDIYPSLPADSFTSSQMSASYGYPHFNLYPPVGGRAVAEKKRSEIVCHPVNYPSFALYPAVYPHFDLYPEVWQSLDIRGVDVGAVARYPVFDLYPAVYPFFNLYPCAWRGPEERGVDIRVEARYPYFNLYPAIYPHFDLWPTLSSSEMVGRSDLHASVGKPPSNSQHNTRVPLESHPTVHLDVFPGNSDVRTSSGTLHTTVRAQHKSRKTHFDLHHNVFPNDVPVSSPSGTGELREPSTPTRDESAPRVSTRLRTGSIRLSLPPSPRPLGGRSPTLRAPPTPPEASPVVLRRIPSSTIATRHSVVDRVTAHNGAALNRSVSMASPSKSAIREPNQLDRAASVSGPRTNSRRDSLVLQRARAYQLHTADHPIREEDPMSSFPLPPRTSHLAARKVVP